MELDLNFKPDHWLSSLAKQDPKERRDALEKAFLEAGLKPEIQEIDSDPKHRAAKNYLIRASNPGPCPLLCAHYDAYPDSVGANDNAAAVSILIALSSNLIEGDINCEFAFLDGEEREHSGAKLFEELIDRKYSVIVNLDICGYGDTIAVYARGRKRNMGALRFCDKKRLLSHNAQLVKFLPEGDDICFSSRIQPVISISVVPKWDIKYLDVMASLGTGFVGRPPEFQMIFDEMDVRSTMHGGYRDEIKWVDPKAMQQVYDYLYDCLVNPL